MSIIKIRYGYKEGGDNLQSSDINLQLEVSPTETPEPTKTVKNNYPLKDKLPYYGKGYVVEKYISPMTLKMILNGASEQSATKEVIKWINSFGDAIGQHKIEIESN